MTGSCALLAIVVIRIPTVALISGLVSPTADKHSDLMNKATSGGNLVKCALTLFFRINPDNDLEKKNLSWWCTMTFSNKFYALIDNKLWFNQAYNCDHQTGWSFVLSNHTLKSQEIHTNALILNFESDKMTPNIDFLPGCIIFTGHLCEHINEIIIKIRILVELLQLGLNISLGCCIGTLRLLQ